MGNQTSHHFNPCFLKMSTDDEDNNNNLLLPAQPVKIEFLREIFEKSRGFASEKTKLDAGSDEANSAASFVFFTGKTRLFEKFRV